LSGLPSSQRRTLTPSQPPLHNALRSSADPAAAAVIAPTRTCDSPPFSPCLCHCRRVAAAAAAAAAHRTSQLPACLLNGRPRCSARSCFCRPSLSASVCLRLCE
jgi:hypothetical protein